MPANASFDKGSAVEEDVDTWFFRPLGLRIARACFPTRLTPDHVTIMALVIGLAGGHLCFYNNVGLNALGVALLVISDIFDSADGQLARMRGTSTRIGKTLDGISDGARFANLSIHLMARLIVGGAAWWLVIPLGVLAGLAHARQAAGADYIRQLYLYLAGDGGEFALAEDLSAMPAASGFEASLIRFYRNYLSSHAGMVAGSLELVRRLRANNQLDSVREAWATVQRPVVRQCAWIGQNIRWALIGVAVISGHPIAYFWITLVPMSLILVLLRSMHERHAAAFLAERPSRLAAAA
ncbi:MAG: CDP-alcohol phosphatidyltransferase family protein [Gemmatimonadales bacterium]